MDRTALAVIVLGVFIGLVYSLSLEASRYDLTPAIAGEGDVKSRGDSAKLLVGSENELDVFESPAPPSKEVAGQNLGYDTEVYDDAEGADARGGTLWDQSNLGQETPEDIEVVRPTFLTVSDEGVLAYYADSKLAYNYSGYDLVLVRFEADTETRLRQALDSGTAIVLDETDGSVLLLLPKGSEGLLDSLIQDGIIRSYEFGGMGTGLGKA